MSISIALIGAGGIGFRHFQALCLLKEKNTKIYVNDIDDAAINRVEEYWKTVDNDCLSVNYCSSLDMLPYSIDICIIATTSFARRSIAETLLNKHQIGSMILEKVLFPCIEDYAAVKELIDAQSVKAYVNCIRRYYSGYNKLASMIDKQKETFVTVSGNAWGLGCNAIHMIDIIDFIAAVGNESVSVNGELLEQGSFESKRKKYREFTGTIAGRIGNKIKFTISDLGGEAGPMLFSVYNNNKTYIINESAGRADVFDDNMEHLFAFDFPSIYMSRLTNTVVEELVSGRGCGLTPFDRSCQIHIPIIEMFLKHVSKEFGEEIKRCPIT